MLIYIFLPFIILFFLLLNEFKHLRFYSIIYKLILLFLGVFAGLRYETGGDWESYQNYYYNIDIATQPFEAYYANILNLQFEIGYFLFNYILKFLGADFFVVFLSSSLFFSYCLYKFTHQLKGNKYIILMIYLSFSYLILLFNETRQSIAIAFFLLGCSNYLIYENKRTALLICILGVFFQISTTFYIIILLLVFYLPKHNFLKNTFAIFVLLILTMSLWNPFDYFAYLFPTSLEYKISVYEEGENNVTGNSTTFSFYLLLSLAFLIKNAKLLVLPKHVFINKMAMLTLVFTILVIYMFPNKYVLFNRAYVLASIFLGISITNIHYLSKSRLNLLFLVLSIGIALVYYFRILYLAADRYIPYHSTLFN